MSIHVTRYVAMVVVMLVGQVSCLGCVEESSISLEVQMKAHDARVGVDVHKATWHARVG